MVAFTSDGIQRFRQAPATALVLRAAVTTGLTALIAATCGNSVFGLHSSWTLLPALVAWLAVAVVTAMDLRWGLGVFIFAAGISPEFPAFAYSVRLEDFVFLPLLGCWIAGALRRKRIPVLHPLLRWPVLAVLAVGIVATIRGGLLGLLPDPVFSWLVLAKRAQYFLVFWIVATTVDDEDWARRLIICLLGGAVLSASYGLLVPVEWGGESRIFAEKRVFGPAGENYNTLSGYLVIALCLGLAVLPTFSGLRARFAIGLSILLAVVGVLLSFSREGLIVLLVALVVLCGMAVARRRWEVLAAALVTVSLVCIVPPVRENAVYTVDLVQSAPVDSPSQNSLAARYQTWSYRWTGWVSREPIIGSGVGCVALSVDNEYLLQVCETGIIGFAMFLWLLGSVSVLIRRQLGQTGWPGCLAWGLAAAFIGLLVQATVAVSFTTIRTMEPFWFALGLLAAIAVPQTPLPRKQKKCAS